jgi:hypothetical protein
MAVPLAVAMIIGASVIISAAILARSLVRVKTSDETIHVIGSARRQIRSDYIIWTGSVSETATTSSAAYLKLQRDAAKVHAYLVKKGILPTEIIADAVNVTTLYGKVKGEPNSAATDDGSSDSDAGKLYRPVVGYQLTQQIEVQSSSVDLVDGVSRASTQLISSGVPFTSNAPMYIYTKLSDLKITMQAEAAKDARERADQIARSSGALLGPLRSANMNTPIITPLYSNNDTDNGVDDTTALNKRITAIVSADYAVR